MLFTPRLLAPGFGRDPFGLSRAQERGLPLVTGGSFPPINVWQGAEGAALTAELPGVAAADLEISLKENVLTLSGERRAPDDGDAIWHRRERGFGRFSRIIQLPFAVDPDRVEARFHDGVLEIDLHRHEAEKPRRIEIRPS